MTTYCMCFLYSDEVNYLLPVFKEDTPEPIANYLGLPLLDFALSEEEQQLIDSGCSRVPKRIEEAFTQYLKVALDHTHNWEDLRRAVSTNRIGLLKLTGESRYDLVWTARHRIDLQPHTEEAHPTPLEPMTTDNNLTLDVCLSYLNDYAQSLNEQNNLQAEIDTVKQEIEELKQFLHETGEKLKSKAEYLKELEQKTPPAIDEAKLQQMAKLAQTLSQLTTAH